MDYNNATGSMKTPNQLRTLATALSLVILALGFSSLGFISFISKQPCYTGGIFSAENAYSFIGGSISILVGVIFLFAAISFAVTRSRSERLAAEIDATLI